VAGAAGSFMNWFVDFYKNMEVGVAVEPGRKTFIMLEQTAYIPKVFFGEQVSEKFVSFVNDKMKQIENNDNREDEDSKSNKNYNTAVSEKNSLNVSDSYLKDNKS